MIKRAKQIQDIRQRKKNSKDLNKMLRKIKGSNISTYSRIKYLGGLKSHLNCLNQYYLINLQQINLQIYIEYSYQGTNMAQAIKALRRMSKKLEETFRVVAYYSARHLSRSEKYKSQYELQFKKIASKMKRDTKKNSQKQRRKHKLEKQKMSKQIQQLKAKKQKDMNRQRSKSRQKQRDSDRHRDKDRHKQSSRSDKYKDKHTAKNQKRSQKQLQRKLREEKYGSKRRISQLQRQREFDFEKDYDLDKNYKSKDKEDRKGNVNVIYDYQQDQKRKYFEFNSKQIEKQQTKGWSQRPAESIQCNDPEKYKIMKIDEETSDFQDDNAPLKVPSIKPRQPLTPYFLFLRYNRFSISESYPNINKYGRFSKVWNQMPIQQKKPYEQQYRRSQQIYAKKLTQYYAVNPRHVENEHNIRRAIELKVDREIYQKEKGMNNKNKPTQKRSKTSKKDKDNNQGGGQSKAKSSRKKKIGEQNIKL